MAEPARKSNPATTPAVTLRLWRSAARNSRHCQRQARNALFTALVGFVAAQLALSLVIACWLPQLRDPLFWTKLFRFQGRLASSPRSLSIACFGSSRTIYGLPGQVVEQTLAQELERDVVVGNLGVWGAGPIAQRLHIERLLASGVLPDVIVLEILPVHFTAAPQPQELLLFPEQDQSWQDRKLLAGFGKPPDAEWWSTVLLPAYHQRATIMSKLYPSLLQPIYRRDWGQAGDDTGWEPLKGSGQSPAVLAATRGEFEPKLAQLAPGGLPARAFAETLTLARQAGCAVVVVFMPEGPAMRSWYRPESAGQLEQLVRTECARVGASVIDARAWLPEESFRDSHHLYPPGAAEFGQRFGAALAARLHGQARRTDK
ncbi:MAG: hypothetical protein AB7K24_11085 [Gemmataceae bacterium]